MYVWQDRFRDKESLKFGAFLYLTRTLSLFHHNEQWEVVLEFNLPRFVKLS